MTIIKATEPIYSSTYEYFTPPGSPVVDEFVLDFPETGGVALKKCGEKNIYDMIQANLVNCDLHSVIESCTHSNQRLPITYDGVNSMIADFTGLTDLGDLYVGVKRMENTWKELPLEVREEFNSDIKSFIRGIGTPEHTNSLVNGFDRYNASVSKVTLVPDVTVEESEV